MYKHGRFTCEAIASQAALRALILKARLTTTYVSVVAYEYRMKRPATQWVKPGIVGRMKHLRGEEDLRHASLQDFREEE